MIETIFFQGLAPKLPKRAKKLNLSIKNFLRTFQNSKVT
jgi:hypothetical protein